MRIQVEKHVGTAVEPSVNVLDVAAMFGLGIDEQRRRTIVESTQLSLIAGELTFVTGPSGSGKSTLLGLVEQAVAGRDDAAVLRLDQLDMPANGALVDGFDAPLDEVMRWLSLAGLNDAFVMLRSPDQLSDGQRYRLRLAHAMAAVERRSADRLTIVLADEFGATLDRVTAKVIAHNLRKWVSRQGVCCLVATTHDDLLESLLPNVLIETHLDGRVTVARHDSTASR